MATVRHQIESQPSSRQKLFDGAVIGSWWQPASKPGRLDCTLCPRQCSLAEGDRGFCFVRENRNGQIVLTTYGRSTGFCIDPIEKKPLNHFFPGSAVLSFGTAGCNLGCQFCQNWDISKSREIARLSESAKPETVAVAAKKLGCRSVAFTYNDPVIWAEYAIDTARECRQLGIKAVAVTAGYISAQARSEFFELMDAANVDLKAFTEEFYRKITYSHLQPVLDTLRYLVHETDVWVELTNLIIPKLNDGADELRQMCDWILHELGDGIPVHFTAFHPDFRMTDRGRTDPETLQRAYEIAKEVGLKYVYVGNVNDVARQSTYCPTCSELLIEREWHRVGRYNIALNERDDVGRCRSCQTAIPGHFDFSKGSWGANRQSVRISDFAASNKESIMTSSTPSNPTAAVSTAAAAAKPLRLDRITSAQRQVCLQIAASSLASAVTGGPVQTSPDALGDFSKSIVFGAFVTLKRGELLRSCCGVLGKPMAVGPSISSASQRAARDDQRFAPISPSELAYLDLDVTLLSPFKPVETKGRERLDAVEIGKHGVVIQRGGQSGLLLPSVATERHWDVERFLCAVCTKAGLPTDAWQKDDSALLTFEGESISSPLSELIPNDLATSRGVPLSDSELAAYAQVAGQNIAAMTSGGTPSYVIPGLPDFSVSGLVLSLRWGDEDTPADGQESGSSQNQVFQGNAIQVSVRPGIALQSNLFQMCQHAANLFTQQQFSGRLQIGLTLGFDPALHGYGQNADLSGVDTSQRAIIVSDARHCGIIFNPAKTAQELLDELRRSLPVGSRDGAVHTVQYRSTMPQGLCLSLSAPLVSTGMRAPAVAGKFYPAEDAARRATVDGLLGSNQLKKRSVQAAIVPHAGLKFSGKIAAEVWQALELEPNRTLVIVSPKHTVQGVNWAVCPQSAWGLSATTTIDGDPELAQKIAESIDAMELDAAAHAAEHGIEVQLPIIERIAPKSKVVGIAMHGGNWNDIRLAASQFAVLLRTLDTPPLLVISSDMNHYADDAENRRRDRLALDALASGDPEALIDVCRANEISMCGLVPAAFVLETLRQLGHDFKAQQLSYSTSADVSGDKSRVVGYAGVLLL